MTSCVVYACWETRCMKPQKRIERYDIVLELIVMILTAFCMKGEEEEKKKYKKKEENKYKEEAVKK
jgi:lipopolysaccharide export system protein LptC